MDRDTRNLADIYLAPLKYTFSSLIFYAVVRSFHFLRNYGKTHFKVKEANKFLEWKTFGGTTKPCFPC